MVVGIEGTDHSLLRHAERVLLRLVCAGGRGARYNAHLVRIADLRGTSRTRVAEIGVVANLRRHPQVEKC
jgi:hypothetical protein